MVNDADKKLVERLRGHAEIMERDRGKFVRFIDALDCIEAADTIEALSAKIAELQQSLVDAEPIPYCGVCGSCGEIGCGCTHKCKFPFDHPDVNFRIEAQAAEIARLREALERIEAAPAWGAPDRWEPTPSEVRQLARAALGGNDE